MDGDSECDDDENSTDDGDAPFPMTSYGMILLNIILIPSVWMAFLGMITVVTLLSFYDEIGNQFKSRWYSTQICQCTQVALTCMVACAWVLYSSAQVKLCYAHKYCSKDAV